MDKAERAGESLGIILLDWEKAFDKVSRSSLTHTLHRFRVHPTAIHLVESLYADTQFYVQFNGGSSSYRTQHTGIRQGCPLSPYLFIIIMSAMWADINKELGYDTSAHFQKCVLAEDPTFNELLYADDTLISTQEHTNSPRHLHALLKNPQNTECDSTEASANS